MRGHVHSDGESQLLSALPTLRLPLLQEEQGDQEEVLRVVSYILQCAKVTKHLLLAALVSTFSVISNNQSDDTFSVRRYLFLLFYRKITNSTVVFCCFGHASKGSVGSRQGGVGSRR